MILFHRLVQLAVSLSVRGHTYLSDQNTAQGMCLFYCHQHASRSRNWRWSVFRLSFYFHNEQEDVAFFSFPFSFEAFYMCEKESEGENENDLLSTLCYALIIIFFGHFYMII